MAYIEKTQSAFNGLIEKPVLSTELLSKPPFKFIFDIINNVHKKTGIFKTFDSSEWDVTAYADKTSKTAFIDKVIKAVDDGTLADIKSIKVLSGKHPELTNQLLQRIAHVANKSEKKKAKKKSDSTKVKKDKESAPKKSKSKEEGSSSKDKDKDSKEEKKKKKKKSSDTIKKEKHEKKHKAVDDEQNVLEENKNTELPSQISNEDKDVLLEKQPVEIEPAEFVRPSVEMARPRTAARPAPPTLKKKQISTIRTSQEPPVAEVPIFNEASSTPLAEDDDAFEIQENDSHENEEATKTDENSGVLVQKIMENKAELDEKEVDENETKPENHFSDEIQVSNLQAEIQKITRQAYPVVQILEFVQEDIEAMMRELEKWRTETRENEQRLKDLIAKEFTDVSRLSNNLSNLDREIKAEVSEISFLKCRVLSNDLMMKERIFRE